MYSLLLANQFISVVLLPDGRKMNFQMIREKQIAHISPLLVSFDIPMNCYTWAKNIFEPGLKGGTMVKNTG